MTVQVRYIVNDVDEAIAGYRTRTRLPARGTGGPPRVNACYNARTNEEPNNREMTCTARFSLHDVATAAMKPTSGSPAYRQAAGEDIG